MTTNVVPQGLFGPGVLYLTRNDIALQTPYNVGFVNEFSYDFSFDTKQLFGQKQFPLLAARSTAKATGKIVAATQSGQALNAIMFGGTFTAGTQYDITTSPATAIPATPFQITPTVPGSGTFESDLGVVNAATNEPLTLVTGTPTAGQYAHTAGQYLFSSADNVSGISVKISFSYTLTTQPGQYQIVTNPDIGTNPTFQLDYKTTLNGGTYFVRFYNAIASKWALNHKLNDFAMPEYDFEFFANAAGNVMLMSLATQA